MIRSYLLLFTAICYSLEFPELEIPECDFGEQVTRQGFSLRCECFQCFPATCSGEGSCLIEGVCERDLQKYHGNSQECANDGGTLCESCPQIPESHEPMRSQAVDAEVLGAVQETEELALGGTLEYDVAQQYDLSEEDLANVYQAVTDAFLEHGMHEAAASTKQEWTQMQAASSSQRRRLTNAELGGRDAACRPNGSNTNRCLDLFNKAVKKLLNLQYNEETSLCSKPSNKLQRSMANCCGEEHVPIFFFWCNPSMNLINCCGGFQATDGWCYDDNGDDPHLEGSNVCPPGKHTCVRWGSGDSCATDTGTCAEAIINAGLTVLNVITNVLLLVFTGGTGNAARVATTAGRNALQHAAPSTARGVLMGAIKTSLRQAGQNQLWLNLQNNVKQHFHNVVPAAIGQYLLTETMAVYAAESAQDAFEDIEWEIAQLVDPTGVTIMVNNILNGADECVYPETMSDAELQELVTLTETLSPTPAPTPSPTVAGYHAVGNPAHLFQTYGGYCNNDVIPGVADSFVWTWESCAFACDQRIRSHGLFACAGFSIWPNYPNGEAPAPNTLCRLFINGPCNWVASSYPLARGYNINRELHGILYCATGSYETHSGLPSHGDLCRTECYGIQGWCNWHCPVGCEKTSDELAPFCQISGSQTRNPCHQSNVQMHKIFQCAQSIQYWETAVDFNSPFKLDFDFKHDASNDANAGIIGWRNGQESIQFQARPTGGSTFTLAVYVGNAEDGTVLYDSVANRPSALDYHVELIWDGSEVWWEVNNLIGQTIGMATHGFGEYSRATVCHGIGGGHLAWSGEVSNIEVSDYVNNAATETEAQSLIMLPSDVLLKPLAIVGVLAVAYAAWDRVQSKAYVKIDETEV